MRLDGFQMHIRGSRIRRRGYSFAIMRLRINPREQFSRDRPSASRGFIIRLIPRAKAGAFTRIDR